MKLNVRFIIVFLTIALVPALFVGSIVLSNAERTLDELKVLLDEEQQIELEQQAADLQTAGLIVGLISLLLVGIIAIATARSVSGPIIKLTKVIDAISQGDFDTIIDPKLKRMQDEVGELSRAFERVVVSLKLAVLKVGIKRGDIQISGSFQKLGEDRENSKGTPVLKKSLGSKKVLGAPKKPARLVIVKQKKQKSANQTNKKTNKKTSGE